MLAGNDIYAEVEEQLEREIRSGSYAAHQKLLPGRQLAEKLKVPHCRLHKALKNLEKQGILYSVHGRGTFIADKTALSRSSAATVRPAGASARLKMVRILAPQDAASDHGLAQRVDKAVEALRDLLPFLELELLPHEDGGESDIEFISCHSLAERVGDFERLDDMDYLFGELMDDAKMIGTFNGALLGIPLLWVNAAIYADMARLERFGGADVSAFSSPCDIFKAGWKVEERSGGAELGTKYRGFIYHACMYGVSFLQNEGGYTFDEARLRRFLEEFKPWIRRGHFRSLVHDDQPVSNYAIYPDFTTGLQKFAHCGRDYTTIPPALAPGGFTGHAVLLAAVRKGSGSMDEARLVIDALCREDIQRLLTGGSGEWLAVHKETLARQEQNSPFPSGTVSYRFDLRGVLSQKEYKIFGEYALRLNTESGKFFMDVQSLDQTIERLMRARA